MSGPTRASTIDQLLHPRDVAKVLNVSLSWLAKARLSGDGPRFVKIGRAVRYLESAVREYIKARTRGVDQRDVKQRLCLVIGREGSSKVTRAPKFLVGMQNF